VIPVDENRKVEERLERIDELREAGGRVVLLAEVRKLLAEAEAEAAVAARDDSPQPPESPSGPPPRAA
jgi:hypothetical protein